MLSLGRIVTIRKSESENKLPISLYVLRSGSFSNTSESEDASSWKLEIPGYKLIKNIKSIEKLIKDFLRIKSIYFSTPTFINFHNLECLEKTGFL